MTDTPSNRERAGTKAWQLIEPHWKAVDLHNGPIVFLDGFENLPVAARHVFAIWWCDSEICNGGFHQFFSNSTGVLAPEALEGFQAIGLHECAELAETAIEKFGDPFPRDREARYSVLKSIELPGEKRKEWDPFYDLDDRYYVAKKREDFYKKLDDFALRHTR